jgi:hypothetical protein
MENIIRNLLMAQRCAHVHHWKTKSFAQHLALGELYEALTDFADSLMEMYMGAHGQDEVHIEQSDPNPFNEQDPVAFVHQLHDGLEAMSEKISEGYLVNKYQELQGIVAQIKYKMDNLS